MAEDKRKLLEKLTEMTNQNKTLAGQVETLNQEKSDARDYGDRFEAKLRKKEREFSELNERFEKLKRDLEDKESEAQEKLVQLEKSRDALEKEVSALRFQLSAEQMQQKASLFCLKVKTSYS